MIRAIVILLVLVTFTSVVLSQTPLTLKGSVYDERNRPLSAVAISGMTDRKALGRTDEKGIFSVNVSEIDSLRFSHVGYRTVVVAVPRDGNRRISVHMQQLENVMEEVLINTGYYAIPKERATGAFSHWTTDGLGGRS